MNGLTMDSTKLLTEKLTLSRELANLKPELEHLRSQAIYQQAVLSEKLALQRQVSTLEVELETEKHTSKRALEKSKSIDRELELQQQVDDLRKDLAREKHGRGKEQKGAEKELEAGRRALKRATEKGGNKEREIELQQKLDEVKAELVNERREEGEARKKFEKESEVEKALFRRMAEKRSHHRDNDLEFRREIEGLQEELSLEKKEKEKIRKEADRRQKAAETRKTVLESKLDQMGVKLRAAQEELSECQNELSQARVAAVKGPASSTIREPPPKNPRKRGALEMSTDVTIGTPDGFAVRGKRPGTKRGAMDQNILGEKSMFSITPFLKRTTHPAPDDQSSGEQDGVEIDKNASGEAGAAHGEGGMEAQGEAPIDHPSPSRQPKSRIRKGTAEKKAQAEAKLKSGDRILGDSRAGISNKKTHFKKLQPTNKLERVMEEDGVNENEEPYNAAPNVEGDFPKPEECTGFTLLIQNLEEVEPKKKKRKLLGAGRTLFDEEDGETSKRPAKITLGPPKSFRKSGLAAPKGGLKGGVGIAAGFGVFSPLKKDRRGVGAGFLA